MERIPGGTGKQQIYPKRRPANNNANHNIIDVIKNSDNGIERLPLKLAGTQRSVCAVPRVDHARHLEGVTPSAWQATPCERAVKLAEGWGDDL